MLIKSAKFIKSALKPSDYPESDLPEVAFAGRSNVGKSSLINSLLRRKRLVKTSSTPGKTRLINFFDINETFCLTDLPGYGYANVPAEMKREWGEMIERYLLKRKHLRCVVLIMDIRRKQGFDEISFMDWMRLNSLAYILVITKADKLSKSKCPARMASIARDLETEKDDLLLYSSKTGQGKEALWESICRFI